MEIKVKINGEERTVPGGLSVGGLLDHLKLRRQAAVVERNREIIRRDSYDEVKVEAGDELEIVRFVGGG